MTFFTLKQMEQITFFIVLLLIVGPVYLKTLTLQGTGYFEDTDYGRGGIMAPSIISPKRVI